MRNSAAQDYLRAREALLGRLREIEVELGEIKSALGLEGGRNAAAAVRRKPAPRSVGTRRRAKRGQNVLAILQALGNRGPAKPAVVSKISGVVPTTVSNALNALKNSKLAARSDKGWSLTPAGKAELARRSQA